MPLEVDDEYWENENPELAFKQPPGKPSTVSFFMHWVKLARIAAHALRTLVSVFWGNFVLPTLSDAIPGFCLPTLH